MLNRNVTFWLMNGLSCTKLRGESKCQSLLKAQGVLIRWSRKLKFQHNFSSYGVVE